MTLNQLIGTSMKVRSEITRNGSSLEVELDDLDGTAQYYTQWAGWTHAEKLTKLQKLADFHVLQWASRNDLLSEDYVRQRIKELTTP